MSTNEIIRDALIRGVYDSEIKLSLLSEKDGTTKLEDVILFIESREGGKQSARRLDTSVAAAPAHAGAVSSFRRQQREAQRGRQPLVLSGSSGAPTSPLCDFCGTRDHPLDRTSRASKCSAYGHQCGKCGKLNHLESVCRSDRGDLPPLKVQPRHGLRPSHQPENSENSEPSTSTVFDTLCSVSAQSDDPRPAPRGQLEMEHHLYDSLCDTWERDPSAPQPTVPVFVSHLPCASRALNLATALRRPTTSPLVYAIAETGCQSCLAGTSFLRHLGLATQHLTPVQLKMAAVNNDPIHIIGALPSASQTLGDVGAWRQCNCCTSPMLPTNSSSLARLSVSSNPTSRRSVLTPHPRPHPSWRPWTRQLPPLRQYPASQPTVTAHGVSFHHRAPSRRHTPRLRKIGLRLRSGS